MGQLVSVVEKPSPRPGIVRFELNRSLSGMGHEHFASVADAYGGSASAHVARQLFETGRVAEVHVYGNIVTVELERGFDSSGLADVISRMYWYWKPGVEPPSFEDLQPDEPPASEPSAGGDGGGDDAMSKAAQLVPSHLLDRARAARERWNAKQG